MAILKALATWDGRKASTTKRGELLIDVAPFYWQRFRKALLKLHDRQKGKPGDAYRLLEIELTLDIHYKRRTLNQNSLMWALYEIIASIMNAGQIDPTKEVTAESLYEQDMKDVAPSVPVVIQLKYLDGLKAAADVIWKRVTPIDGTDLVTAEVIRTSSKWNTVEMARHMDYLFNRIAMLGVDIKTAADVGHFWHQFKQYVNDADIIMYTNEMSADSYRLQNPICEGCGDFIGQTQGDPHGRGHLHHIRTRGAAGALPETETPERWLMLCPECHAIWENPKGGVEAFIEKSPHCEAKIRRALDQDKESEREQDDDHSHQS